MEDMLEKQGQARLLGEEEKENEEGVTQKEKFRPKTVNGYWLDEVVSAIQKSVRRGDEDGAMFWAIELAESGYSKYLWDRIGVMVGEEIGLADPDAYPRVHAMRQMYEDRMKSASKGPFTYEVLGPAILYICRAPKSREGAMAAGAVLGEREEGRRDPIPEYARDWHTRAGRELLDERGVTRDERGILWWMDWAHLENVKPGNRWLKRNFAGSENLSLESRQMVYEHYLQMYGETDDNQA